MMVGGQRHALATLTSGKRPGVHCIGGWVGTSVGRDTCGKSGPHRDSIPGPSSQWRVAIPTGLSRPTSKGCGTFISGSRWPQVATLTLFLGTLTMKMEELWLFETSRITYRRGAANKTYVFRWRPDSSTNIQLVTGASNFAWRSIVKVLTSSPTNQPTFI